MGTLTVDLVANTATFTADLGKAGNSLDGFGKQAEDAGEQVDFSMREARGSLALVGDEFGIHLPREIRTMIAEIPGVGFALEALLPIMGAVFAAKMIYEWVEANEKAAKELGEAWTKAALTSADIFDRLGDRLLEVGIKADELAGDHFGALQKQMALIDRQTMSGIIGELDKVGKQADEAFSKVEHGWFMQLLMGRADVGPAKAELAAMVAEIDKLKNTGVDPGNATRALLGTDIDEVSDKIKTISDELEDRQKKLEAFQKASGGGGVDETIPKLQQQLDLENQNLATLQEMRAVAAESVDVGEGEKKNKTTETDKLEAEEQNKIYEAQQRGLEQRRRAEATYAKDVAELKKKAAKEDENIAEEEFRATTAVMEGQAKTQQGLANEQLKQSLAMAKLKEEADEQAAKHALAMHQSTTKQAVAAEVKGVQDTAKIEEAALDQQIASLNKHDADYLIKLQEFENKKRLIVQQSENQIVKIRQAAEEKQYQDMRSALAKMDSAISSNVAHSLVEGKNMAKGLEDTGKQMLETGAANLAKMILLGDMKQAKDAAHAAASAFTWVMQDVPFPANVALAPAAAAAAFAGVMAFERGGMIPGTGPTPIIAHGGETVVTRALTDRVAESEGRGKGRKPVTIVQNITTPDADSFKASQSQLHGKAFHAANKASRRNH